MKRFLPSSWRIQRKLAPYIFIAPFYLLFLTFMAYPLVSSIWTSMFRTRVINRSLWVFVGFQNFTDLMSDPVFWKSVWNTTFFAAGSLFIQLPIALLLALLLNSKALKGRNIFRLSFFAPVLVAGVFIALAFSLIYEARSGLLNRLLEIIGLRSDIRWLEDRHLVMPAIIMTGVWRWSGFNMIYFLAGLQSVRQELYEAAAVDGAGKWQSFWFITLPSLKPIIIFVTVMSMIGSFQLFDLPFILTNGGQPADYSLTIVMYLYRKGFEFMNLGYASAIGWVLVVMIFAISMVQLKLMGFFRRE